MRAFQLNTILSLYATADRSHIRLNECKYSMQQRKSKKHTTGKKSSTYKRHEHRTETAFTYAIEAVMDDNVGKLLYAPNAFCAGEELTIIVSRG